MNEAQQLRDEFEAKLAELQKTCRHEEQEGMDYSYDPGHYAGYVWVCCRCEKILRRKK